MVAMRACDRHEGVRVALSAFKGADRTRAELLCGLTLTDDGEHEYLSTGCLHGEHGYCQGDTGAAGAKIPAVCKFCQAPCICVCHIEAPSENAGK
jgi:hypothetical protein